MRRSKHTLSHYKLASADMGQLIPISCVEALPGDTFQHHTSALIRVAPLNTPVMHPTYARVHHFFVPNRLVWDGWEDFITGGPDGNDSSFPPTITRPTGVSNDLFDYLGVAPTSDILTPVALPIRAYNLIYNEFYRDQDLASVRDEDDTSVARIAWEKDYFTSARPWAQKGDAVTIPLSDRAPVRGLGTEDFNFPSTNTNVRETDGTGTVQYASSKLVRDAGSDIYMEEDPNNAGFPNVWADLSQSTAVSVDDLRTAFGLQRYQEARARWGSRYTEYLRYLGVRPSDARLQRPEFLGGGKTRLQFSEVLQTAPTDASGGAEPEPNGIGNLFGHGIAGIQGNAYRKFFEEHGFILTLLSVRPKAMYVTQMPKMFHRWVREQFYQRELERIGQEQITQDELWPDGAGNTVNFGWQDRYRSYREIPSSVAGDFRTTLNQWHMGRDFASAPTLNQSFIECDPSKRIQQVTDEHQLWIMANHHMVARRLVGRDATPRVI